MSEHDESNSSTPREQPSATTAPQASSSAANSAAEKKSIHSNINDVQKNEDSQNQNDDHEHENPRKAKIWNSRASYMSLGTQHVRDGSYKDAAIQFEKYIRILEIYFGCKSGELSPDHFKNSFKTAELSVVACVYWELIKIYDMSQNNFDRQLKNIKKLIEFSPLTSINQQIIKSALDFEQLSQNPQNIRSFIDQADTASSGFFGKILKKIKG